MSLWLNKSSKRLELLRPVVATLAASWDGLVHLTHAARRVDSFLPSKTPFFRRTSKSSAARLCVSHPFPGRS